MAAFSIGFGLEIKDNTDEKLIKNGGEELWVGCRGGYIHKFEGSKVVNVNDLNVNSMHLQPHHEFDVIEIKLPFGVEMKAKLTFARAAKNTAHRRNPCHKIATEANR